ncbi:hypothetical protein V6N13_031057 [Hibiscus sabdariffa]|uniref:Uncharacterized protein n=1 Tax=Hibiscus sabdariffa TaxID=183260 RepID=A0ABR2CLH0_9ROSI
MINGPDYTRERYIAFPTYSLSVTKTFPYFNSHLRISLFKSPTVAAVARHSVKMSHTVGTTQVGEDISKNAEKIADSVTSVKSEETVKEDKEEEADSVMTQKFEEMEDPPPHLQHWICAPEKATNTGGELLEPEQTKDEEAEMWYNVRFSPGINFHEQSKLLRATLTNDRCYLHNTEDDCIMEVFTTKEDAARIKGLDEVVSVEPFLGVHNVGLLSPPAPEVGRYRAGVLLPGTMRYI